jgi:DNA-binding LacI/PurR family transcriptional regulator
LDGTAAVSETRASTGADLASDWEAIRAFGPSVLFVESPSMAEELVELARASGVSVPDDLSMVTLGEQSRQRDQATDFTRFSAPRTELGARAVLLLSRILSKDDQPSDDELRVLLTVTHIQGSTLVAASR